MDRINRIYRMGEEVQYPVPLHPVDPVNPVHIHVGDRREKGTSGGNRVPLSSPLSSTRRTEEEPVHENGDESG